MAPWSAERAERAALVMLTYGNFGDTTEDEVVDLLADIRHYCLDRGLAFERLDRIAQEHFASEL